jgi:hypothetical protein
MQQLNEHPEGKEKDTPCNVNHEKQDEVPRDLSQRDDLQGGTPTLPEIKSVQEKESSHDRVDSEQPSDEAIEKEKEKNHSGDVMNQEDYDDVFATVYDD